MKARIILALVAAAATLLLAPSARAAPSTTAAKTTAASPAERYYDQLRAQLRWLPVLVQGRKLVTPDAQSRLLLARSAAERAGLAQVGLDFRDVYGVIEAETSWVPRSGMGRNGVASHGLAQFEPATARALGVRDMNDAVEAVHGAARLLREAAEWSARRIAGLGLGEAERAARLREGVSIYYNLSSRARERWRGAGVEQLPVETRQHIRNSRRGAQRAAMLHAGTSKLDLQALAASLPAAGAPAAAAAKAATKARTVTAKAAAPRRLGTIAWSRADGGEADQHVVWSDGQVTRQPSGRVRWTSAPVGGAGAG